MSRPVCRFCGRIVQSFDHVGIRRDRPGCTDQFWLERSDSQPVGTSGSKSVAESGWLSETASLSSIDIELAARQRLLVVPSGVL